MMVIIAVDGPAASGKGTLARRLARHYGFHWLDTGLLYRAVGRQTAQQIPQILQNEPVDLPTPKTAALETAAIANARAFDPAWLDHPELRSQAAADWASRIAAILEVRAALLAFQRDFATQPPGAVLDGRDIGTVVCPQAQVKIYVTADITTRVARRLRELHPEPTPFIQAEILKDLTQRDQRDSQRATAPLAIAPDAFVIDSSGLDADAVFAAALAYSDCRLR